MQGIGAIVLIISVWLFYCGVQSFRPIGLARAILSNPKNAAQTIDVARQYVSQSHANVQTQSTNAAGTADITSNPSSSGGTLSSGDNSVAAAKEYANAYGERLYGTAWSASEFDALQSLWQRESGWNYQAVNKSSGAYGIPQALPASKLAAAGSDWQSNAGTQIQWGLQYIKERYGDPIAAWNHEQKYGWY